MSAGTLPPFPGKDLNEWARKIYAYLNDQSQEKMIKSGPVLLQHRTSGEKATTDGIMMYDPQLGEPVYSKNGAWYKLDGTPV